MKKYLNSEFQVQYSLENDETVTLHYTYHPGCPERGPTYSCGGTPAEPEDVEIFSITDEHGDEVLGISDKEHEAAHEYALLNHEEKVRYAYDDYADYKRGLMQDNW